MSTVELCPCVQKAEVAAKTWLQCCKQWRYPKWWWVSPIFYSFGEGCMQFVAYREVREANQWSLGAKCSVPTGPRSSYTNDRFVLIWLTGWHELGFFSSCRVKIFLVEASNPCAQKLQKYKRIQGESDHNRPFWVFQIRWHLRGTDRSVLSEQVLSWVVKMKTNAV